MNYRHAFHAGNFADVFKHAILARILVHLTRKETPVRFIDTHAGAGRYDLSGAEAARSPEWRDGIARLLKASPPAPVAEPASALSSGRRPMRRRRPARILSRLAGDRPGALALAGPDRALRGARRRTRETDRRARARWPPQHCRHGRLCRAQRLRAAEGAARPGADRPAVRDARRSRPRRAKLWRARLANGRPGSTPRGARSASPWPTRAFSTRSPRWARRTFCGSSSTSALDPPALKASSPWRAPGS